MAQPRPPARAARAPLAARAPTPTLRPRRTAPSAPAERPPRSVPTPAGRPAAARRAPRTPGPTWRRGVIHPPSSSRRVKSMKIKALGHVVLRVTDCARAEQFYNGLLGLPVCARFDQDGMKMSFFTLGNHHDFAVMEVG